jgi:hypothetical protein
VSPCEQRKYLRSGLGVRCSLLPPESGASPISHITLAKKLLGKRSAGKPLAPFEVSGAGNGLLGAPRQHPTLLRQTNQFNQRLWSGINTADAALNHRPGGTSCKVIFYLFDMTAFRLSPPVFSVSERLKRYVTYVPPVTPQLLQYASAQPPHNTARLRSLWSPP